MDTDLYGGVNKMTVALVDVGIGNIKSVVAALDFLGANHVTASSPAQLAQASHVILPGVGAFGAGMRALRDADMVAGLRKHSLEKGKPLLGICLGMQLLAGHSEEGDCDGLGILPGRVELMSSLSPSHGPVKVPHVGFSALRGFVAQGLFADLPPHPDFYFTHSYALKHLEEGEANIAYCEHGELFVAAFQIGNLCGAQFHPEKSQTNGLRLMKNFLSIEG